MATNHEDSPTVNPGEILIPINDLEAVKDAEDKGYEVIALAEEDFILKPKED
jgi:hypothetical protein